MWSEATAAAWHQWCPACPCCYCATVHLLYEPCRPVRACCCPMQDIVEGGVVERPRWLGLSVHLFNTVIVWLDLTVAHPRTFSYRSQFLSLGLIFTYTCWILVCSHFNGLFPYPFLNKLPWPQVRCVTALTFVCQRSELLSKMHPVCDRSHWHLGVAQMIYISLAGSPNAA